jgi:hypothetical protein
MIEADAVPTVVVNPDDFALSHQIGKLAQDFARHRLTFGQCDLHQRLAQPIKIIDCQLQDVSRHRLIVDSRGHHIKLVIHDQLQQRVMLRAVRERVMRGEELVARHLPRLFAPRRFEGVEGVLPLRTRVVGRQIVGHRQDGCHFQIGTRCTPIRSYRYQAASACAKNLALHKPILHRWGAIGPLDFGINEEYSICSRL